MKTIKNIVKLIIYYIYVALTKHLDFTHYWVLSRKLPIPIWNNNTGQQGNHCYGNWHAVRNAMGNKFDPHCMIEHGLYFGRYLIEDECTFPGITTIYTFGPYRQKVLSDYFGTGFDKNILSVGPYLKFSDHLLKESQRMTLKKKWGRMLLVFPTHSGFDANVSFDYGKWLSEIECRAKEFDTVVICLFWLDIYNANYRHYLKKKYKIVCCGNRFDPFFLSRQKDLISISDMTMSNNVGTHVGYCISMEKPHYIYPQAINVKALNEWSNDSYVRNRMQEYAELISVFSEYKEEITDEQRSLVRYYWGNY
jgi:hypothetical protein